MRGRQKWICNLRRQGVVLLLAVLLCLFPGGVASAAAEAVQPRTLGCILPLSGPNAAYGQSALDALLLAAGVFDPRRETPIRLRIEDSKSDPREAGAAVGRLFEAGAVAILGPLGSPEALEAASQAQRLGIPILTLTQREGITAIGDQVFRHFLTLSRQIEAIVRYAREARGLNRFALLYPEDAYGREMARLFREEVARQGGEVRREAAYGTDQTDFGEPLLRIGGTEPLFSDDEGGEGHHVAIQAEPDYEALFIPDADFRVTALLTQLADYGLAGIQRLGTSGWRSHDLVAVAPAAFEGALFADAFFINSQRPAMGDFIDRFYLAYRRTPDLLEALVYDAAAMAVRVLIGEGAGTREAFRAGLLGIQGYPGVTGDTSFPPDRDARKTLFILTIRDGRIVQVR